MHHLPPFHRIRTGALDLSGYADLLARLWAFHNRVDAAAQASGLSSLGNGAERLARLHQDLGEVGVPPPAVTARPFLPAEPDAMLGCLYVAQGSSLGGREVARQLDYLFGDVREGRSFFAGGASDGATWRALVHRLEAEGAAGASVPAMTAGAVATFNLFESCLSS